MHVLTTVFFNAPMGGLQRHVGSQVRALLNAGHRCTLLTKSGPFSSAMEAAGATIVQTTYEDLDGAVEACLDCGPYDVVHAHPFASRIVGHRVARSLDVPFAVQFHGNYPDSISTYHDDVDLLFVDCTSIRDLLVGHGFARPGDIVSVHNGFDPEQFFSSSDPLGAAERLNPRPLRVLLSSRFDSDRHRLVDAAAEALAHHSKLEANEYQWRIVGSGELIGQLQSAAETCGIAWAEDSCEFLGWVSPDDMADHYRWADVTVGPSRCVIESMACGTPAIAMGHHGYLGPMMPHTWHRGVYTSFEGAGAPRDQYWPNCLVDDLEYVRAQRSDLAVLGRQSELFAHLHYHGPTLDGAVVSHLELLATTTARAGARRAKRVFAAELSLVNALGYTWALPRVRGVTSLIDEDHQRVRLSWQLEEGASAYLTLGDEPFDQPARGAARVDVVPGMTYELEWDVFFHDVLGEPASVWIIQYDDSRRLREDIHPLGPESNIARVTVSEGATSLRVLLRMAGQGSLDLGDPRLSQLA